MRNSYRFLEPYLVDLRALHLSLLNRLGARYYHVAIISALVFGYSPYISFWPASMIYVAFLYYVNPSAKVNTLGVLLAFIPYYFGIFYTGVGLIQSLVIFTVVVSVSITPYILLQGIMVRVQLTLTSAILIASSFTLAEYGRDRVLPTFTIGSSIVGTPVLSGLLPYGGVYLVSFSLTLLTLSLILLIKTHALRYLLIVFGVLALSVKPRDVTTTRDTLHFGVVHPGVAFPSEVEFKNVRPFFDKLQANALSLNRDYQQIYLTMAERPTLRSYVDLVVWPEAPYNKDMDWGNYFDLNTTPTLYTVKRGNYNCSELQGTTHKKQYLVPFGEYAPLGLNFFNLPANYQAGSDDFKLVLGKFSIGSLLCYEVNHEAAHLSVAKLNPDVIIAQTNTYAIRNSLAAYIQISYAKALYYALHKPVVLASVQGPTLKIDSSGIHEINQTGAYVVALPVILDELQPTFYARYGSYGIAAYSTLTLVSLVILLSNRLKPKVL